MVTEKIEIVNVTVKKINEKISVVYPYNKDGKEDFVTIYVEIDYNQKKFDILNSNNNNAFKFCQSSHQSDMWIATLEAMKIGIKEAKRLLGTDEKR